MSRFAKPYWDGSAGQYCQLIGYTTTKHGRRVRKRWYFGAKEEKAKHESVTRQLEWAAIIEATRPVWEQPKPTTPSTPSNLTIAQAVKEFVAQKKKWVGLAGGIGIKPSTFNGIETTIRLATGRDSIDTSKQLSSLNFSDLESFVQSWMKLPDGLSTRTAVNYCLCFKQFLDWCHGQSLWQKPGNTDALFSFRAMKQPNVKAVSNDTLKKLLATAQEKNPKTLLYILLALNCGMYQSDISDLRRHEVVEFGGEHFIVRQRTKMKGVDESTSNGHGMVTTYLFPETYKLLMQFAEKTGDHLLCNTYGSPLWEESIGQTRRDAISPAYDRITTAASVCLSFRQLRKHGWNAVKRLSGGDDVARRWAGQKAQGISRFYNHDDYKDVTNALKQWRKELVAAGVLVESVISTVN